MAKVCPERDRLVRDLESSLGELVDLTRAQLDAFNRHDEAAFSSIDKKLENTLGEKERAVGALKQHEHDHGCAA